MMKHELKQIADMKNNSKVNFQKKVDDILSNIFKEMYRLANEGKYTYKIVVPFTEFAFYLEVIKSLEKENFKVIQEKAVLEKQDGIFKVYWE